ncbi:GerAB/ArcD/ProY family transporter, partial [Paenibacillus sp. MCAF20]
MSAARVSISKFQLFFLIIQSQIGIGLLSLPSDMQQSVDGDGWISTLIAGAAVQLLLLIYWLLYKRFPNHNFSEMTIKLFGNITGKAYNIFFSVCCMIIAGLSSTLYIEMINMWLLPHTPNWALLILIVATCLFLALEDIRIISRFMVVTSFLFVILILMSFLDWTKELHFSYLLPIGKSSFLD